MERELGLDLLPPGVPAGPLWDIAALAEYLDVTVRMVRRLVAERRVPYYKVGKFVRFCPIEIAAWLESNRISGP